MTLKQKLAAMIPAGSIVLALTTLGSYVMGLIRDRTFAQTFGASRALDAYNAAFIIPDFIFNVAVASGIAAAFVPVFAELNKGNADKARRYADSVITASVIVMGVAAVFLFVFAGPASRLVAPGFDQSALDQVANLLRILALSPILFAASNALGAMLVARRRFLFYGLSPVLYNAGIIGGTLLLAPRFGITGVALGTLAGAALHLLTRVFDAFRTGYNFRPGFSFRTSEFRQTIKLMLPKMVGHPVELATFWGFTAIASGLGAGSIVVLNFARNFESVPVSIIGIAIATAVFPALSDAASAGSRKQFLDALKPSFLLILAASSAAALFMYFFRHPLINIILGGREFGPEAVARTASVLGVFSLAIVPEALSQLIARAFYATKNTAIPVVFSILAFAISVGGGWLMTPALGINALPLAFAAGSFIKLISLSALLPRRLKKLG